MTSIDKIIKAIDKFKNTTVYVLVSFKRDVGFCLIFFERYYKFGFIINCSPKFLL